MRHDDLLKHRSHQEFLVLARHGKGVVEGTVSDQSDLQFPVASGWPLAAAVVHLYLILMSTERFLFSSDQVELASGWGLVAVVAHVAAGSAHSVCSAGEAIASKEPVVTVVAGKGRETALGADRVGEELVSSPVVAQGSALHCTRFKEKT